MHFVLFGYNHQLKDLLGNPIFLSEALAGEYFWMKNPKRYCLLII